jgi:hypothetical protein
LDRDCELEDYAPKRLTEEQQTKITDITNFLTGKASASFTSAKKEAAPTSDDFDFEENFTSTPSAPASVETDEDDFFADL